MGEQLQERKNEVERKRQEFLSRCIPKADRIVGPRHMDEEEYFGRMERPRPMPGGGVKVPRPPDEDDF